MTGAFSIKQIAWKRVLIFVLLILIPNFLVMQWQVTGPVDDILGLGSTIDLVIILPLAIYFFGFRKRVSLLVLFAFMFWGLLIANWMIPNEADAYLSYFNYSVIALEAGIIAFELFIFITVLRKFPSFVQNFQKEKTIHYHFLISFSAAIENTFSFQNKYLNRFQFVLRVLATDIAAIYYSLFSWRKKAPMLEQEHARSFTFHKDSSYLGVFLMLVHAMLIEIVAVHVLFLQFSHLLAWIVTILDIYALLFILSDYQAIRLSPVIVDSKGLHVQKGIRLYGFIPLNDILEVRENTKSTKEVENDRKGISLVLHGLEKEQIPYVIKLNKPVEVYQLFGRKKVIESIYIKMDDAHQFNEFVRKVVQGEQATS